MSLSKGGLGAPLNEKPKSASTTTSYLALQASRLNCFVRRGMRLQASTLLASLSCPMRRVAQDAPSTYTHGHIQPLD